MSKIGDLIVRMMLDSKDYEKGLKKTKQSTNDLGSSMGKIFTSVAGKFMTIGTAVAALGKTIKDAVNSNQVLGDSWQTMTAQMKSAWDVFTTSLGSFNFENFFSRMSGAIEKAKELYDAVDAMGEIETSYNMKLAEQSEAIAQLKTDLDDTLKTDEERIEAGEKLLKIYEDLEGSKTRGLSNINDATLDKTLQDMNYQVLPGNEELARQTLVKFFMWLGDSVEGQLANNSAKEIAKLAGAGKTQKGKQWIEQMQKQGVSKLFAEWAIAYNQNISEEDRKVLEQAYVDYKNQASKFTQETKRINTKISSLKKKSGTSVSTSSVSTPKTDSWETQMKSDVALANEEAAALREEADVYAELEAQQWAEFKAQNNLNDAVSTGVQELNKLGDASLIAADNTEKAMEKMASTISNAADMMTDAIVNGMVNGMEELGYAVAGLNDADAGTVVKALLSPLADAAVSAGVLIMTTGEALEAIKAAFRDWFGEGGMGAIAAGAALVAVGTAAKVGLAAIGSGKKSTSYANSSSYGTSGDMGTFSSELTVYVKGTLKGSDIILSGQSTQNSWNR